MRIKLPQIIIALLATAVNAQIYTPNGAIQGLSGNNFVGIGTNAPTNKLEVYGSHGDSRILLHSFGNGAEGGQADLMLWASEPGWTYTGVGIGNNVHNFNTTNGGIHLLNSARGGSYIRLLDNAMSFNVFSVNGTDKQAVTINSQGNLGINTDNATAKLEIIGSSQAGYEVGTIKLRSATVNQFMYFGYDDQYLAGYIQSVKPGTDQQNLLLAPVGGNVGIGTKSPDCKLAVNGTIHSKEVKVDMNGWSDFVFKKDYSLPTLQEVEKHIAEKGHLENIPSEEEVLKNGINLGEMNSKLLQKIEELTLYMIEQDKKTQQLKNIISEQNKRLEKLENKP
ncbi:hypothetical protein ASE40_16495 [Flavobacterium sp. Root935]|uniref:hypothetical protein n=1 Tax=Flavobacterium sp. Root935 TaxID=1736610 RepID=UPI00070EF5FD|nr:hypothetical protein [Flavobacterium sp. Root935]KRD57945.1 hypothetical protein ASE40_16495 [Flavobacterium sp. Root935]